MKNGNVNEFVDQLYYGAELLFVHNGQKFFIQGQCADNVYTLYLERITPPAEDYIWTKSNSAGKYSVDDFLSAPIWDGKTFWEVESEMEWVDW